MASLPVIDVDPVASRTGSLNSMESDTTPDTEYSPPESPFREPKSFLNNKRIAARKKLAHLSQEEKVRRVSWSLCTPAKYADDKTGITVDCGRLLEDQSHPGEECSSSQD